MPTNSSPKVTRKPISFRQTTEQSNVVKPVRVYKKKEKK